MSQNDFLPSTQINVLTDIKTQISVATMKAADELRADIRRAASMKGHKTQAELASALGITPQYMNDILRGTKRLTPDLVNKATSVLGVNPVRAHRWQRLGATESGWKIDTRIEA